MTPEELRKKMAKQREEVAALKEWFGELFPDHPELMVSDSQFGTWVRQYGFEYAVPALEDIAKKEHRRTSTGGSSQHEEC